MKYISFILTAIISGHAVAAGVAGVQSNFVIKEGPNWKFLGEKALDLPKEGKFIFGSRLVPFEKWKSTHKDQLLLFPNYQEPMMISSEGGGATKKDLEVFDARFAFVVNQPLSKFTAQSLLNMKFIQDMDPNFRQTALPIGDIVASGDPETDKIAWCTGPQTLCLESTFNISLLPAKALEIYYASSGRKSSPPSTIQLQSEISFLENAEVYMMHNSETRVVSQKTFYINHFFQYAVTNVIFNKISDTQTLVVGMTAIGVQEDVLMIGGDFLESLGISSTREFIYEGTGMPGLSGVENGLVPYAREMAVNLKAALEAF